MTKEKADVLIGKSFPLIAISRRSKVEAMHREAEIYKIPFSTYKTCYYKWMKKNRSLDSLVDLRKTQKSGVLPSDAAKDYAVYLMKFVNSKTALSEMQKDYEKSNKRLPRGFSYANAARFIDEIKKLPRSDVVPSRCSACEKHYASVADCLKTLTELHSICSYACPRKLG